MHSDRLAGHRGADRLLFLDNLLRFLQLLAVHGVDVAPMTNSERLESLRTARKREVCSPQLFPRYFNPVHTPTSVPLKKLRAAPAAPDRDVVTEK